MLGAMMALPTQMGDRQWLCRSMVPPTGNAGASGAGQECSPQRLGVIRTAEP